MGCHWDTKYLFVPEIVRLAGYTAFFGHLVINVDLLVIMKFKTTHMEHSACSFKITIYFIVL